MTSLAQAAEPQFPRDQYLLPSRVSGRPRVSSWTDGRQRALAFYYEHPTTHRVYLIRTQAPYITERLQQYFGTQVDGLFGERTREAIVNHARANGVNFAPGTAATGPLLAYALQTGFLGGGRVAFPPAMDFPDTAHPVLASNPEGRRYTSVFAMDLDSGAEVQGTPSDVVVPPLPTQTQAQTHSLAPSTHSTASSVASPATGAQPGASSATYSPTSVTQVSQQQASVFSGNTLNLPGLPAIVFPGVAQPGAPAPPVQANPFLRPLPPDGKVPTGFEPVGGGYMRISAFIRVDGRFLVPNAALIPVEYGKPDSYKDAFPFLKTKEKV